MTVVAVVLRSQPVDTPAERHAALAQIADNLQQERNARQAARSFPALSAEMRRLEEQMAAEDADNVDEATRMRAAAEAIAVLQGCTCTASLGASDMVPAHAEAEA